MQRYVALLRGINLGRRRLPMSRLKALFEELGLGGVETFIASGNVIFSSRAGDTASLESRIAGHLAASLGYEVDTFVRTLGEIASIARGRVFEEDGREGITIHVGFLQKGLDPGIARRLAAVRTGEDEILVKGTEYYWLCRVRTPDSKFWALPEVRALRLPTSTMRNISSIRKLAARHAG
ncbi:MAG TPA: DUF1697 domain-containing protein [Opitutaceae bacterium]|nr:DUF1697 domain-containing protein [Opitutaceae bacterium]